MSIVTLETVLGGGSVNLTRVLNGLLVCMAFEAERRNSRRFQIDPGRLVAVANEVTGQASQAHRRVEILPLRLVAVALDTLGTVGAIFQLNRVDTRERGTHQRRLE
jgi:hypothetical protein